MNRITVVQDLTIFNHQLSVTEVSDDSLHVDQIDDTVELTFLQRFDHQPMIRVIGSNRVCLRVDDQYDRVALQNITYFTHPVFSFNRFRHCL